MQENGRAVEKYRPMIPFEYWDDDCMRSQKMSVEIGGQKAIPCRDKGGAEDKEVWGWDEGFFGTNCIWRHC